GVDTVTDITIHQPDRLADEGPEATVSGVNAPARTHDQFTGPLQRKDFILLDGYTNISSHDPIAGSHKARIHIKLNTSVAGTADILILRHITRAGRQIHIQDQIPGRILVDIHAEVDFVIP